jgi:hypothetical protein
VIQDHRYAVRIFIGLPKQLFVRKLLNRLFTKLFVVGELLSESFDYYILVNFIHIHLQKRIVSLAAKLSILATFDHKNF